MEEELLLRRLERERLARKQAEQLLEEKSLELYSANKQLAENALELEKKFKQSTQQLQISEIRNNAVLQSALDAIVTIDIDGKVLEFNPAASKLFGYEPEAVIGNSMSKHLIPERFHEQHEQGMQHYRKTREGAVLNRLVELTAIDSEGDEIPVEAAIIPIDLGGTTFFTAFMRDISERKQYEELIIEAKEAAESASQAKSDFLAVMSHEIRTPINAILGAVTILREMGHSDEQRRYLQMADEASKSLLSLINDILDFSKIEAGKLELESIEFDLVELVEETLGLFVKCASDLGIELASFISKSVPRRIVSDPGKFRQILLNLLSNALKFTTQGGILVCMEMDNKDRLKTQVIDTGIGIEEAKIGKLFDQFVQVDSSTNRKYGGTGLGLAISSRLANLLGGEMDVQSIHDIGSQFWFTIKPEIAENIAAIGRPVIKASRARLYESNPITLCALTRQLAELGLEIETNPLSEGQSPTIEFFNEETSWKFDLVDRVAPATTEGTCLRKPVKTDDLLKAVQGKKLSAVNQKQDDDVLTVHSVTGRRLLLAEDSQANQIIAITFLKSAGYKVDAVANGQEALDAVMSLPYELVLMDVSMPEMDGLEATRRVRELPGAKGQIKIIALTANVFKDDLDRCMEAGMNGFIPKPIDKNNLLTTLAKFLPAEPVQDTTVEPTEIIQDTSCLDMDVLGQLVDDVDEEVIPIMMQVYFKEVDNRCRVIEEALSSSNLEILQEEAHALKSSSGALGANGLCDQAEKLELACKEGRVNDALALANSLNGVAHECMDALSGYFKHLPVDK